MVAVAILAAGRGTRMKSNLPKVLHSLAGRTLVEWVLDGLSAIAPERRLVVVGHQSEAVRQVLQLDRGIEFVEQREQLGTGHAVQQLLPVLQDFAGDLLVLNGDIPLLRPQTLQQMLQLHQEHHNGVTLMTAQVPNPQGYGRVFCDGQNRLQQIIEDRDCTPAQRQNHRVNAGVYCFHWPQLAEVLPQLQASNAQQEYYITDAVGLLHPAMVVDVEDYQEILGVNDRKQLAMAHGVLQTRVKDGWMAAGVTLIDPSSITIDDTVQLHSDVVIEPQTHLRGKTVVGAGSHLGPGSLIENSHLGENVSVLYSVITDSVVEDGTRIGPYAHLRQQVQVGSQCRIGNFVELKKTQLGDRTNVAHLSYLGDATLGTQVNVGAGTLTANYDGFQKQATIVGDRTKTGCNSVLVAPITLGSNVNVAAGSVIVGDVPDNALVIARPQPIVKPDYYDEKGCKRDDNSTSKY